MRAIDASPPHRGALVALRWVLIAVCGGLILFSDQMSGRLGLAVLLLLAVIMGRYGRARWARSQPQPEPLDQPAISRGAPETDERQREAGK